MPWYLDKERSRFPNVLEAAGIPVNEENLFLLVEGMTPAQAKEAGYQPELLSFQQRGRINTDWLNLGLRRVSSSYWGLKDDQDPDLRANDMLELVAKRTRGAVEALERLRGFQEARLLFELEHHRLDLWRIFEHMEILAKAASAESRKATAERQSRRSSKGGRPPDPETHLFHHLHRLFSKLSGSEGIGAGGPGYKFAKAAAHHRSRYQVPRSGTIPRQITPTQESKTRREAASSRAAGGRNHLKNVHSFRVSVEETAREIFTYSNFTGRYIGPYLFLVAVS